MTFVLLLSGRKGSLVNCGIQQKIIRGGSEPFYFFECLVSIFVLAKNCINLPEKELQPFLLFVIFSVLIALFR